MTLLFADSAMPLTIQQNPEASTTLARKVLTSKEEVLIAAGNPDFYIGLTFIAVSLLLAWFVAFLIRRKTKQQLAAHPPKKIDSEFITRPLSLLGPLLALLFLSAIKPFSEQYANGGDEVQAVMHVCLAYLAARCVLLLIGSRLVSWLLAFVIMAVALLDVTGFIKSITAALSATAFEIGKFRISLLNLIHGLIILVVVFWGAGVLSRTLESYLRRSSHLSYNARELTVKFFRVFVYFVALMITLSVLGVDLTAFAVFGGALGVGIGLGLQKITANFVSGITLLLEKSIKIGDLVEVAGNTGWVRQLNIRYALLETADGRELLIPNDDLISTRVTNWTYSNDHARVDITVILPHNANIKRARQLMLDAAQQYKNYLHDPAPSCYVREFSLQGIVLLLSFWIPDVKEGRYGPQSEVMLSILEKFRAEGISFAEAWDIAKAQG